MKLIANENFQFRGIYRAGTTITVPESILLEEIKKGKCESKRNGYFPWMSGLLEHCIPANEETARFIEKHSGERVTPAVEDHDEIDDSDEIRDIRAEFDSLGKAYDKRWQLKRLRNEILGARISAGEQKENPKVEKTIKD